MIKIRIKNVEHEIDVKFLISENELKDVLQRQGQLSHPSKKVCPTFWGKPLKQNSRP